MFGDLIHKATSITIKSSLKNIEIQVHLPLLAVMFFHGIQVFLIVQVWETANSTFHHVCNGRFKIRLVFRHTDRATGIVNPDAYNGFS